MFEPPTSSDVSTAFEFFEEENGDSPAEEEDAEERPPGRGTAETGVRGKRRFYKNPSAGRSRPSKG